MISRAESQYKNHAYWHCLCDCGNEIVARGSHLTKGEVSSCGCRKREIISKAQKEYNKYDLSNDHGIGYTSKGDIFYFDLDDYDKIKNYCWYKNSQGYIEAYNPNGGTFWIHRVILLPPPGKIVDHIDGNPLNNIKRNLRICTYEENSCNRGANKNNSLGIKGVYEYQPGKFKGVVTKNYKEYYKHCFNTPEEANEWVIMKRKELHKDFAVDNRDSIINEK